jgi:hypothetical protein
MGQVSSQDVFVWFDPWAAGCFVFTTLEQTVAPIRFSSDLPGESLTETYHKRWNELHSEQHASPEWIEDWLERVPEINCGCRLWVKQWIADNPPRYHDWYQWTVELHDAVNAKLGKPKWKGR